MNIVLYDPHSNQIKLFCQKTHQFNYRDPAIEGLIDGDVLFLDRLGYMSRDQFCSWMNLTSWFDGFSSLSAAEAMDMQIVFFDATSKTIKLCDDNGIASHPIGQELFDKINDDVAYVESAHLLSKKQFVTWLSGAVDLEKQKEQPISKTKLTKSNKKYIHSVDERTILIEDIEMEDDCLRLKGKYHFVAVDDVGEERLAASPHYNVFLKKGKIEIVDEEYVMENKYKYQKKPTVSTLPVGSVDDFANDGGGDIITINIS